MKTTLIILSTCLLFAGCAKEKSGRDGDPVFSKTFFTGYLMPERFLIADDRQGTLDVGSGDAIPIVFKGREVTPTSDGELFSSIADKTGGKDYNNYLNYPVIAIAKNIVSANLVSDADFDAGHPAGTSLNDLVIFHAQTAYDYIQNGYKGDRYKIIHKKMSELTTDDLKYIMFIDSYIGFTKMPDVQMDQGLTMTVTFDDGEVLTTTQDVVFSD